MMHLNSSIINYECDDETYSFIEKFKNMINDEFKHKKKYYRQKIRN